MITLHFYLRYRSSYGENFFVSGNIPELGNNDPVKSIPLSYLNDEFWHGTVEVANQPASIGYKYIMRGERGVEVVECATDRTVNAPAAKILELQLIDTWNYNGEYENAFYTQPFTQTLLRPNKHRYKNAADRDFTHLFKVKAPLLGADEVVCMLGNAAELGNWDENNPVIMLRDGHWFTMPLNLANTSFPVLYKYGVYNVAQKRFVRYETGDNRMLYGIGKRQVSVLHDGFIHLPNQTFKGAGIAIPVFSLRTAKSFGVGEFTDIKPLADWAAAVGLKLIQLLPVNDTTATHTWTDSYPYAPISVFALHPIYLNLEKLAGKQHADALTGVKRNQKKLNDLPELDYEAVMKIKWVTINELYNRMKAAWLRDEEYQAYYAENKHWLNAYAAFCYLRDKYNTADFTQWKTHQTYNEAAILKMLAPQSKQFDVLGIHLFTQYHLHLQLKESVDYAHKLGIVMKGDLPIGIYRNSTDAWVKPALYNMDAQAGAPPDDFAVKGQNWGFPTYNWKQMQQDGFAWWKQRFEQMSLYFDAFRIDHILGFFRIWSIPMDAIEGIMGHFIPCIPVYSSEFAEKGIWFDHDRYCKPFINDSVLEEFFGEKTEWIKETFLDHNGWGSYSLRGDLNTQRKIESWFNSAPDVEPWIKGKLFDLVSNVILFEDKDLPGAGAYHFRIAMDNTLSFRFLDAHTQGQLKELYIHYFFRRQNEFWRKQAMQKLPALKASTNMLVCGEDLGMVPDCVPDVMKDTGLLSLEIQRMPKNPNHKFFHPSNAPYMSVVTPSTHDMSTVRGWWEEDPESTQLFYNTELGQQGKAPFYCEPWINRAILTQHFYSPAMWSIFQLQDLLGMDGNIRRENPQDERINIPADPKHYWRYRMHLSLEQLQKAKDFNHELGEMIKGSGR